MTKVDFIMRMYIRLIYDIMIYENKDYRRFSMKLQNNLQIEQLLNTDWANQFNRNQLYRIREGLNHNLDVSIYAKTTLAAEHMREIVKGLKLGFDMTKYTSGEYTENQLRQIVYGLENGLDASEFDDVKMSSTQMSTAQEFMKLGFNMNVYRNSDLRFEDNYTAAAILETIDSMFDYMHQSSDEEFEEIFGLFERYCAKMRKERAKRTSKK